MREYKRLTKSKNSKSSTIADNVLDCVLRLQELEDKIENGTLIELYEPYMILRCSSNGKDYYDIEEARPYCLYANLTKEQAGAKLKELKDKE